mmetsp:Transcript_8274/g.21352  ORF Transcript_8274/g.21352 Transcript_8274/m.21352 type:complete len:487 (+) Transcript_8274:478-1938(+)
MTESVVPLLEVVGLTQDSRVLLRHGVVIKQLVVSEALGAHEPPLRCDHVRGGPVLAQLLVNVLQEVLVQDHVRVHPDDVVVLGLLDAHVPCTGNGECVLELPPLHQRQVQLGAVLPVDRVDVVGGVVVDDDDLELEVRFDLLLAEPRECLLHNALLVEGREDTAEVDAGWVQLVLEWPRVLGNGAVQRSFNSQHILPISPGIQDALVAALGVVRLAVHNVLPLGLHRTDIAVRLVVNEVVPANGRLVARENDARRPFRTEVLLHPLVLLLRALGGVVRVRGRHDEDFVPGGIHCLDGLHGAFVGLHSEEEALDAGNGLHLLAVLLRVVQGDVPVHALLSTDEAHFWVALLHSPLEGLLVVAQGVVHVHKDGQLVVGVVVDRVGHSNHVVSFSVLPAPFRGIAIRGNLAGQHGRAVRRQIRRHVVASSSPPSSQTVPGCKRDASCDATISDQPNVARMRVIRNAPNRIESIQIANPFSPARNRTRGV